MCFPRRFLFFEFIFLPFFYFPVSFSLFSEKRPKKRENSRHCVTKYLFAFCCLFILCYYTCERKKTLRHYVKELFAPDERFIYTTMRKKYLHSQHSLDIFWLGGAERGSLFLVTLLFLHRNKKVKGPIRYKLKQKKTYIYYYVCFRLFQNKFTRQWWYCNRRLHLYKFYGVFWKLPLTYTDEPPLLY